MVDFPEENFISWVAYMFAENCKERKDYGEEPYPSANAYFQKKPPATVTMPATAAAFGMAMETANSNAGVPNAAIISIGIMPLMSFIESGPMPLALPVWW